MLRNAHAIIVLLIMLITATLPAKPVFADPLDFPVSAGHFYAEANGAGGAGGAGFIISNADGLPFWSAFREFGGVARLGYPVSQRFVWNGLPTQLTQRAVLQWNGTAIVLANVLDDLHDAGKDVWLQLHWLTPPPTSTLPDRSLSWTAIVQRHLQFLQSSPALWQAYTSVPDPLQQFGLPMSPVIDEGAVLAVRCQRAVLQFWLTNEPWAAAGTVTIANTGDILKASGLLPPIALVPASPATEMMSPLVYAAIGSSDALGTGASSPSFSYPALLNADLRTVFGQMQYDNLGEYGATIPKIIQTELPKIARLHPYLVTITVGGDDFVNLTPPDQFQSELHRLMMAILAAHPGIVALATLPDISQAPVVPPVLHIPAAILLQQYNTIITQEAKRDGVLLVDLYTPSHELFPTEPTLVSSDGFHPSNSGYALYARYFWQAIDSPSVQYHATADG